MPVIVNAYSTSLECSAPERDGFMPIWAGRTGADRWRWAHRARPQATLRVSLAKPPQVLQVP